MRYNEIVITIGTSDVFELFSVILDNTVFEYLIYSIALLLIDVTVCRLSTKNLIGFTGVSFFNLFKIVLHSSNSFTKAANFPAHVTQLEVESNSFFYFPINNLDVVV